MLINPEQIVNDIRLLAKDRDAWKEMHRIKPNQWLPIESAPMDGTPILIWHRLWGCGVQRGYYYSPQLSWRIGGNADFVAVGIDPSHWHPLPCTDGIQ